MNEMEICPICGIEPKLMVGPDVWVECPRCHLRTPDSATTENAVKKWNVGIFEGGIQDA